MRVLVTVESGKVDGVYVAEDQRELEIIVLDYDSEEENGRDRTEAEESETFGDGQTVAEFLLQLNRKYRQIH